MVTGIVDGALRLVLASLYALPRIPKTPRPQASRYFTAIPPWPVFAQGVAACSPITIGTSRAVPL